MSKVIKISNRVFTISEHQLEFLLYNHFGKNESLLKRANLWIFIALTFEIILIAFFGSNAFVHYKGHIIFGGIFISWTVWASYTSWIYRKRKINEFINELKELGL